MVFAWLPRSHVLTGLTAGTLRELPPGDPSRRYTELYLVYGDREAAGQAALHLEG